MDASLRIFSRCRKLILHQLKRDDVATSVRKSENNGVALPTTDSYEDCCNVTSLFYDLRCHGVILQAKVVAEGVPSIIMHNFRVCLVKKFVNHQTRSLVMFTGSLTQRNVNR
jgi:hypothetical protein